MGLQFQLRIQEGKSIPTNQAKMKAFVALFALAAAVNAEADPAMIYSHAGVIPYASGVWAGHPWAGYTGIHGVHYGKRSADAEAKPYYGLYGAYGIPSAYGYGIPTVHYGKREAEAEAKPYYGLYGAYGVPAVSTYGYPAVYHYGKRSADAEAEAKPYYGLYGAYGVPAVSTYGYPGKKRTHISQNCG